MKKLKYFIIPVLACILPVSCGGSNADSSNNSSGSSNNTNTSDIGQIDGDVVFNVTIPEALKEGEYITIGSSINDWTPSNLDYAFEKVDDLNYRLVLDLDTSEETVIQYKYTKQLSDMSAADQWKCVEKDSSGMEIGNRLITVPANNEEPIVVNDTVAKLLIQMHQ